MVLQRARTWSYGNMNNWSQSPADTTGPRAQPVDSDDNEEERVWTFSASSSGGTSTRIASPHAIRSVFFQSPLAVDGKRRRKDQGPPLVFAEPPPSQLICTECREVFDDPASIQCGHIFCRGCITESMANATIPCSVCASSGFPLTLGAAADSPGSGSTDIVAMLDQLRVHCRFGLCEIAAGHYMVDEAGCQELLCMGEVREHEATCGHAAVCCEHAAVGCLWTGRRSELGSHAEHCMFKVFSAMILKERQETESKLLLLEAKMDAKMEEALTRERQHWQELFAGRAGNGAGGSVRSVECRHVIEEQHAAEVQVCVVWQHLLLTGSCDSTIRVWSTESWQCEHLLTGHSRGVIALAVCGDSVFSGSDDSTIRIWSAQKWRCDSVLRGHNCGVNALAVLDGADATLLLSGSEDGSIRVWNLASLKCQTVLRGHGGAVNVLHISGRLLMSGSGDQQIRVWNCDTWECERALRGHTDDVLSLAVWGRMLFSGSFDQGAESTSIRVWNMDTWQCERRLAGHTGSVNALVVDRVGCKLFSGSCDETIRVWSLEQWNCEAVLTGHTDAVQGLVLLGPRLVSVSDDLTTRIWQ